MTRRKKSRKSGPIGIRKQEARPEPKSPSIRVKKAPKGKQSGNRNSLMLDEHQEVNTPNTKAKKKNPKIGSKKPIELVPSNKPAPQPKPKKQPDFKPSVELKKVAKPELTPEQELQSIESDEKLIALVERVEQGEMLQGKDAKYFNKQMDRHQALLEELGIEEQEDDGDELGADQWDDLLK